MACCCGAGGRASPAIVRVVVMVVGRGWRTLVACCGGAGGRSPSLVEGGDGR